MTEKKLMKGNEAFGLAAILGGARYYFGYPITPQNEVTEYMSRELPKAGGSFLQAESELAAINMAYGAAAAGGRVFISSSSPGIALMQEGLSGLASIEAPVVVLNVMRGGPGIGNIQPGQADYFQATRGGGNGDYHSVVYAPASIQEAMDMIVEAFEVADRIRNPVMVLADGMLGQMMEPVQLPDKERTFSLEENLKTKPWALTGHHNIRERNVIKSVYLQQDMLEQHVNHLWEKYKKAEKELVDWEEVNLDQAQVVFVSFGTTSRIVKEAMKNLKNIGIETGMIRPKTLWPFPYPAFERLWEGTEAVVSCELSKGQMIQDVALGMAGRIPVSLIHRTGGMLLTPEEITKETIRIIEGGGKHEAGF
jgi:2-oxoglutarate ferredoxin oxidoreductase subunit alpha